MAEFVVELYVSRKEAGALARRARRLDAAAAELRREGCMVRYRRRIFLPEDETCLLLYEADSEDAVYEAGRRADLPFARVTEAAPEVSS